MKTIGLFILSTFLFINNMFGQSGTTSEIFKNDYDFSVHSEMLNPFLENGELIRDILEFWRLDSIVTFGVIEVTDSVAFLKTILTYNEANKTIDSEYFQKIPDQDEHWRKETRTLVTLNDKNQQIQSILFIGDEDEWRMLEKTEYSYNDEDKKDVTAVFHWSWNNGVWVNDNKTEFEYNNQGYVIRELHYNTYYETDNWRLSYKKEIVYNTNNELTENTKSYWNYQTSMWDYSYMYAFEYESGVRSFYDYNWDSTYWKPVSKNIGYHIDSYTIATDGYTYTGDSIWVHDEKTETRYDINGNRIYYESLYLNTISNSWVGNRKSNYMYNESGKILMIISYIWKTAEGIWGLVSKMEYDYDDNGLGYYDCRYYWSDSEYSWVKNMSNMRYYSNPSSITDYHKEYNTIQISPNPCTTQISVNCQNPNNLDVKYIIYTLSGNVVFEGITKSGNTINVNDLDIGYYVIKLEVENMKYSGKFIKL